MDEDLVEESVHWNPSVQAHVAGAEFAPSGPSTATPAWPTTHPGRRSFRRCSTKPESDRFRTGSHAREAGVPLHALPAGQQSLCAGAFEDAVTRALRIWRPLMLLRSELRQVLESGSLFG